MTFDAATLNHVEAWRFDSLAKAHSTLGELALRVLDEKKALEEEVARLKDKSEEGPRLCECADGRHRKGER